MPVCETLYGSLGLMYASVEQVPICASTWTVGVRMLAREGGRRSFLRSLLHPCVVAVGVGLGFSFLPLELPAFLDSSIYSLGRCTIPASMLVIGAILADGDLRSAFSWPVLYYSLVRLLVLPLGVMAVLSLVPMDPVLRSVFVLMTGMPAGNTASILADEYGRDTTFASNLVFTSTLLSMLTLPLLCALL